MTDCECLFHWPLVNTLEHRLHMYFPDSSNVQNWSSFASLRFFAGGAGRGGGAGGTGAHGGGGGTPSQTEQVSR